VPLKVFHQFGDQRVGVGNDAEIDILEDRRAAVGVDRDLRARVLDALGEIFGAGNAAKDGELRRDFSAGLTDLAIMRQDSAVDDRPQIGRASCRERV